MASVLSFINQAANFLGRLNSGCNFVISCAGQNIKLPVTPASFEVNTSYNNSSVNINSLGDINMLGKRGLTSIKFGGFFPAQGYSFAGITVDGPYTYIKALQSFATKQQPCRIAISGTNINTAVTIDSFSYSEKDGTSDVYYELELREYRYILPTSDKLDSTTKLTSRVAESIKEKTINFYPGMDIMDVAAQAVGQLFPMTEQGQKQKQLYKQLVKSGITIASSFKATKLQIQAENFAIKL